MSESPVSSAAASSRSKPPSLQACISCRKSHLKCDGHKPVCSRCALRNNDCVWIESRRGYRDHRKASESSAGNQSNGLVSTMIFDTSMSNEPQEVETIVTQAERVPAKTNPYQDLFENSLLNAWEQQAIIPPAASDLSAIIQHHRPTEQQIPSLVRAVTPPSSSPPDDELLDTYYKHFYPGHPYVIPRRLFQQQPSLLPEHVRATMRFVASHYVNHANQVAFRDAAAAMIFADNIPQDGFLVQALITYIMGCSARSEPIQAMPAVEKAISVAMQIGMNQHAFSIKYGRDNPTLQECWRRTWWALYLLDGLITATAGMPRPFRLHSVSCDTHLPGSDEDYNELRAPRYGTKTLEDMEDRTFSDEATDWSSFAYMIEAMSILGRIFNMGEDNFAVTDPQVEAIDASISTLLHSLPSSKRDVVVGADGKTDECLLSAHMLINMALIFLHRPRSILTFVRNHYRTVCSNTDNGPLAVPALAWSQHTSKAIKAADSMINLVSLQRPMSYATPCLMCGITIAATVHLPAYATAASNDQAVAIKERLKLGITALGAFGETWPKALEARGQVARFAREMFSKPDSAPTAPLPAQNSHAVGHFQAESVTSSNMHNSSGIACFPQNSPYKDVNTTNGPFTTPVVDSRSMSAADGSFGGHSVTGPGTDPMQRLPDNTHTYQEPPFYSTHSSLSPQNGQRPVPPNLASGTPVTDGQLRGRTKLLGNDSSDTVSQTSSFKYQTGFSPLSSSAATPMSSPGIYVSPTGILCNQTPEEMAMAMRMAMAMGGAGIAGMNGANMGQMSGGGPGIELGMEMSYPGGQLQSDGGMGSIGIPVLQTPTSTYHGSWQ